VDRQPGSGHYLCSAALADGVKPKAVAKAAGITVRVLLDTYGHVMEGDRDRLRKAVGRLLPSPQTALSWPSAALTMPATPCVSLHANGQVSEAEPG
jgi:hypothetical protein